MTTLALRTRLTLEAPSRLSDDGGGAGFSWTPIGVHYASVEPATGSETFVGSAQAQRVTHRVTLRHASGAGAVRPRADQRFRAGERILLIRAVFESDPGGRRLVCLCEETKHP